MSTRTKRKGPAPRDPQERFAEMVARGGSEDCWEWQGSGNGTGYGRFYVSADRTREYAHRFAFELANGPIPDGLHIDHTCRNRRCCNPAHLEAVTQAENNRRAGRAVTHCPKGHAYTPENTYARRNGSRACRACWPRWRGGPNS